MGTNVMISYHDFMDRMCHPCIDKVEQHGLLDSDVELWHDMLCENCAEKYKRLWKELL